MEDAQGFAHHIIERAGRLGAPLVLVALALMVAAFASVIIVAELMGPASEPIVAAPFRWGR